MPEWHTRVLAALYSTTVHVHTRTTYHGTVTGTDTGTGTPGRLTAAITGTRHTKVNPENLTRLWNIGIETAKRTYFTGNNSAGHPYCTASTAPSLPCRPFAPQPAPIERGLVYGHVIFENIFTTR